MAEATPNPFNAASRPPLWLVTYDLAPVFFDLAAEEQYKAELADAEIGVQLLFERIWKAAYTTTDLKTGWLLLKVPNQDEAEKIVRREQMYGYFTNLKYTPVYSATQAGFNLKIIWGGFKRFLGIPPKQGDSVVPGALAVTGLLVLTALLAVLLLWWGFSKVA